MQKLMYGDCLERMKELPDACIDFIFTDLPYGTTKQNWDSILDLDQLWVQYDRVLKPNGCVALFAQSPFDKVLACSHFKTYRYEWVIEKTRATGHLNAKKMPMKAHESVLIFYKHRPVYHPQMTMGHKPVNTYTKSTNDGACYGKTTTRRSGGGNTNRYPRDVLKFSWDTQILNLHPNQKPLDLCLYFLRTYTNPGFIVLDSCMGSGSIGVACQQLNLSYIGIEKSLKYYWRSKNRLLGVYGYEKINQVKRIIC